MKDPYSIPSVGDTPSDEEKAELERKRVILLFYVDEYLPGAVCLEHWGPERRYHHLPTDMAEVDMDPSGKKKVMVTVTSEAFGLLIFDNCREAWIAGFQFKDQHGWKTAVPGYSKKDESTEKYKAKYAVRTVDSRLE